MRRGRRVLILVAPVVGALALVAVVAAALARDDGSSTAVPLVGQPAPSLAGETLQGEEFVLEPGRHQLTLVNVWASWCGPCRQELPLLAATAREAPSRVAVVTVNTRDGPAAARSLLEQTGTEDLLTVKDVRGRIAVSWGATGVPETFVVDAEGVIRAHHSGAVTQEWVKTQIDTWGPR
jgi:cytochrome c biogenesis protein CcmG, thiol:disulfide interchange protein DsbE